MGILDFLIAALSPPAQQAGSSEVKKCPTTEKHGLNDPAQGVSAEARAAEAEESQEKQEIKGQENSQRESIRAKAARSFLLDLEAVKNRPPTQTPPPAFLAQLSTAPTTTPAAPATQPQRTFNYEPN